MTNPREPNRPDILRKNDDSVSAATIGGIAVAVVLFLGAAIYLLGPSNREVAGTDQPRIEQTIPAPSTTGQGGTQVMPGRDQNVPASPAPESRPQP